MVRIKVYRASHLAAVAAAVLLAVVLAALLISRALSGQAAGRTVETKKAGAAVEVAAAFSLSVGPIMPAPEGTPVPEDEHTDAEARDIIVEIVRPEAEAAPAAPEPPVRPRVLIYHTHTHEAYEQVAEDPYAETETWRTADQSHSVVRVGEALAQLLTAQGVDVVHDVTDHEPPELKTAYARSLKTLEGYAGQPFDLYIDLHRDAWNASLADCAEIGGQRMAQLMTLVGNGGNYEIKPDYEANLAFAARLTEKINALAPGLCREVMVKNGRYNQHIGTPAILIEVGHNKNTLPQALASMPYLADALAVLLTEENAQ